MPKNITKGEIAVTRRTQAFRTEMKFMSLTEANRQRGRSNGAITIQKSQKAHRWTSETARQAALKSWKRKGRKGPFTGRRLGRKIARAARTDRKALRILYADRTTRGVSYREGQWRIGERIVSERAALIKLGHLASPRGYVPDEIQHVPNGRELAPNHRKKRGE